MDTGQAPLVYILAGETSGDVLGARLIAALRRLRPGLRFAGVGGPRMAEQGFDALYPMSDLNVMGLLEVLPRVRLLRRRLRETAADLARQRPAVVVTIDSPGYMLRVLRIAGRLGLRRAHYVAPQVWAWREHRVKHFPGHWERLLCLLPFEPAFFARHGLPSRFVGHPVLESGAGQGDAQRFRTAHGLAPDATIVVLMPGSRRSEAPRLLPVFGDAIARLARDVPGLTPVLPVAPAVAALVARAVAAWAIRPIVVTDLAGKHDAYAAAAAALTKSGTSTLELALAGVPMAVTYRVNPLSAAMARRLIRVPYVAMVNLLAEREVVPELLQGRCTGAELAQTVLGLLRDPAAIAAQRAGFADALRFIHPAHGTPSEAAAREVLDLLDEAMPHQPGGDRAVA